MPSPQAGVPGRLPGWLLAVASLAIVFHLGAVTVNALAAPSGPWPNEEGPTAPPLLAFRLQRSLAPHYLNPLHLDLNYHFLANRAPATPGVYLLFRLQDEAGREVATVKLPDDGANWWVRHRQSLLSQVFGMDQPVTPPQSEVLPAPGQRVPTVRYWDMVDGKLQLKTVNINQVPRDRPVGGPPEVTFALARSYTRYLCRTHGAAKARLERRHQDPIRPFVLTVDNVSSRQFDEVTSDFGEFSK